MDKNISRDRIDKLVVVIANVINLGMVIIFLSRGPGWHLLERISGLFLLVLIIPLAYVVFVNLKASRDWWAYVIPAIMVLFLIVEMILDYILQMNFRETWLLGPYLLLYYLAEMMMIGYAFLVGKPQGFFTLLTYFLQLTASFVSYRMVGY